MLKSCDPKHLIYLFFFSSHCIFQFPFSIKCVQIACIYSHIILYLVLIYPRVFLLPFCKFAALLCGCFSQYGAYSSAKFLDIFLSLPPTLHIFCKNTKPMASNQFFCMLCPPILKCFSIRVVSPQVQTNYCIINGCDPQQTDFKCSSACHFLTTLSL